MAALQTDILAELVLDKHRCLLRLRDLGRRQSELIETGDMTALLDLLAVKQRSLLRLQQVERELEPFRKQDADGRHWRSSQDRQACAERLRLCEGLFAEIVAREKSSESALKGHRDEAAARLHGVHDAETARGAYGSLAPGNTNQLDLLSDA